VSIAFGVKCSNGIVLGVDLEYSQDLSSMPGQKMFWLPKTEADYFVLIAAAGNPDTTKTFMEVLESELAVQIPHGHTSWTQLKGVIKSCLKYVYSEHVDAAPRDERASLGCDLLVALRILNETRLYHSNRTMLVEEKGTYCHGVGLYAARCLSDIFLDWRAHIHVSAAAQIVAFIVAEAAEHIQSVGKGSDIHTLPNEGPAYSLLRWERDEVNSGFGILMRAFQGCLSQIGGGGKSFLYPHYLDEFKKAIDKLRESQAKREEERLTRHLMASTPQPTKADQSHHHES